MMFMDIYITSKPQVEEKYLAYLGNNVDVVSEITDTVPYAKKNSEVLVNKGDLERLIKNLKMREDRMSSLAETKFKEQRLKNIERGIEVLQDILDNFDFEKNFLYIFYQ